MKQKTTRRALVLSLLSLLLCCSMLVGTTFAWFTDSVTSGKNKIVAGNLDIELEYWKEGQWVDVKEASDILTNELWEPGVTEVAYLRVANAGTLALKYQLGINIVSELDGTNVADETFKLSDYIQFGVEEIEVDDDKAPVAYETREAAIAALTGAKALNAGYTKATSMASGEELYLALVVYMPTTVGNEANYKTGTTAPEIELGISVFATQYTSENDSFDELYDKGAAWTGMTDIDWYLDDPDATEYILTSAEELAGLAAIVNGTATAPVTTFATDASAATVKDNFKGKTIKLGANIDLRDVVWTPIGDNANPFLGNFDGQGHTVSNLYVVNEGWAGLIGHAGKPAGSTIQNVTIDGATILSNRMAGAVVGQLYGSIDNCHVKNATIKVTPNKVGDSFDNGDKVGGIVGWLGDNDNNRTLSNCTATDVELSAYRDVGGIVGYVASSTTVKGNSVSEVTITVDQSTNYYGDKDVNAGYICGRVNGTITEENNVADTSSAVDSTYSKNGLTLKADGEGEIALYLVPETYEGTTVTVPEGVTTIGNYAFAYNENVETVVLPSTVTDLGRGFDSSTVKKVVLNEGLTTISSRAFRSTTALEEVVIPSTVTEIADNAFQKSSLKEIVIPASVTTIGETAFGASLIEKVTFEGDIEIQGYAFRGCTKLRTVIMNGDVEFVKSTLNGRNSCWFCNGESNNPNTSNITFTVISEEVKEKVLTAMGAERNNTTVMVAWSGEADYDWYLANPTAAEFALSTSEELAGLAAIVNGTAADIAQDTFSGQTIKLTSDIDLQNRSWTTIGKNHDDEGNDPFCGTFDGQGHTVYNLNIQINDSKRDSVGFIGSAKNAKIKNLTIKNVSIKADYFVGAIVGKLSTGEITNCHVTGKISIAADRNYAAGIVGDGYYTMENCSVVADGMGSITSTSVAGGLCGRLSEGTNSIKNCTVKNVNIQSNQQIAAITGFAHYNNTISGCTVENVNLTLTITSAGKPAIGLASGLWYYKDGSPVTICDNTFKNVTINANAPATGTANILCGWEWSNHLTGIVESNNVMENVVNNLNYVQ